jgi:hypothetical protein
VSSSTLVSIVLFLLVAGALALFVNLILPALWYSMRAGGRRSWAASNGFVPCDEAKVTAIPEGSELGFPLGKGGKVLSCISRGPIQIRDFRYTQTLGGLATKGVDVARALIITQVDVGRDVPHCTVRPWAKGAGSLMAQQLSRASGLRGSVVQALFSTIQTGDAQFDETFQVTGADEAATRKFLDEPLRRLMIASDDLSFEFVNSHVLLYERKIASASQLDEMTAMGEAMRNLLRR